MSNDRGANFPATKVVPFHDTEREKDILRYGARMGILSKVFGVKLEDLEDTHKIDLLYQGWKNTNRGIGIS